MAGFHRRVSREAAQLAHPRQVVLSRAHVLRGIGVATRQLEAEQRRVSLIHVILAHLEAGGVQHAHAAHAEHHLLLETVRLVPP